MASKRRHAIIESYNFMNSPIWTDHSDNVQDSLNRWRKQQRQQRYVGQIRRTLTTRSLQEGEDLYMVHFTDGFCEDMGID